MAGGIGSRFWPMSKVSLPKQFLDILGTGETLIQQTFRRLQKICPAENILIVTNKNYKTLCQEQLADVVEKNILCEPAMRNTAPCVAYAAFKIQSQNPDANMIIAASDHIITKEDEFVRVVNDCLELSADNDVLLTIGITPSRPDTGYGYIQAETTSDEYNSTVMNVKSFKEKPDKELADVYLLENDQSRNNNIALSWYWNSGMFVFEYDTIMNEINSFVPNHFDTIEKIKKVIDYQGELIFDTSMPDGNPRKLIDSQKINNLGWEPSIDLDEGLKITYSWFLENN